MNEEEENSLKASPLTLIGALKAPIEGEEVERRRERKRAKAVEVPREPVPTIEHDEESYSKKTWGF